MEICIKSNDAQFTNLNSRVEGNHEDPQPACDCDFKCVADGQLLQTLLGCDHVPPFWTDEGDPKYYGLKPMSSWAEIKSANVTFGEIELKDVKVKKFGFKPIGGRQIELSLQVQISHPSDDTYIALVHAQLLHDTLEIQSAQQDMFE